MRKKGWELRLLDLIRERRNMPYIYGANDCGWFCVDTVIALTGIDPFPGAIRPKTEFGALKFLVVNGYRDLFGLAEYISGGNGALPNPKYASQGDIVLFKDERLEDHLAICMGVIAVTPSVNGLLNVPMSFWKVAWRV